MQEQDEEDTELMHRVAGGDQSAFDELYKRYAPIMLRIASSRLRQGFLAEHAEDIVNECLYEAYQIAGRYCEQRSSVSTWLKMILWRRVTDEIRKGYSARKKFTVTTTDDDFLNSIANDQKNSTPNIERLHSLRSAIQSLPDDQRLFLELKYESNFSSMKIAEHLKMTVDAVYSLNRRILVKLKKQMMENTNLTREKHDEE